MARTRAEDFPEKQRAILASAAAVLGGEGIEKASMARIAERARVSKALLYHYYPGKDALVFAIIHSHLTRLDSALEQADDAALPAPDRLRRLIHVVLDIYRNADDAHRVQLGGTATLPEAQRATIHAIERRILRRVAAVLQIINPGLGKGPLLMPATLSIFGMLNWVYMWFREDGPITRAEYADLAGDLILHGMTGLSDRTGDDA